MILSDIRAHLEEVGRAPLAALCRRFAVEPDAMRGMLDVWIGKRRLRRVEPSGACGGCALCDPEALEIYEWTGD